MVPGFKNERCMHMKEDKKAWHASRRWGDEQG